MYTDYYCTWESLNKNIGFGLTMTNFAYLYGVLQHFNEGSLMQIYRVIKKDGLNFVRLYFLNYTWYVDDLHNI